MTAYRTVSEAVGDRCTWLNNPALPALPKNRHRIGFDEWIRRHQRAAIHDRLGNQNAVERIPVGRGKLGQCQRSVLADRQRLDTVQLSLPRKVVVHWEGQLEAPERMFDDDLGHGQKVNHLWSRFNRRRPGAERRFVVECQNARFAIDDATLGLSGFTTAVRVFGTRTRSMSCIGITPSSG